MAERLAYLEAVIGADITQFRKGMRDIRNETGILSETIRGVSGVGRTLTFAYTAPLLVFGSTAVQAASEFDAAMHNINAIAGLTGDELDELSRRTLEFGKTTRAGAIGSAEALYTVFSSGLTDVTQAFATMEVASMTAEAGLANVNTTTEALVGAMLAYGDTSEENARRTSDSLTQMVAIGVGSMEEFANSIATVTPAAVGLGVEIEELYGDVAFLTQQGFSAARATTALNSALTAVTKPTEAMEAALGRLGVAGGRGLVEKFGGLNEGLVALIETTDGSQEAINALFGNIRGSRAVSTFINNLDRWRESTEAFNDTVEGATLRAWESQMDSFAATWDKLKSAIQGLGIVIGQALFPVLTPIIKGITDFVNTVSSGNPKIIAMSVAILGVSAAIPPLLWLFGSLLSPIGLVIGAIAGLITAFTVDFAGVRTAVTNTVGGIIDDLMPLWDSLTRFWELLSGQAPQLEAVDIIGKPVSITTEDIITVEEPKSLWQVYEEGGYADRFSWQAFIEEATAGGWMGGAVTPSTPIRITPDVEVDFSAAAADMPIDPHLAALIPPEAHIMQGILMGADAIPDEQQTPLQRAIDNMGEQIETQIDALIARIPNLISTLMPRVGTAFKGFLESIVPELSGGIGLIAGKVSAFLFDQIVDGVEYVFSGGAAGDATSIVSSMTTWINTNIITPFADEFMAAIEGTELQTAITGVTDFITDLKNAFSLGDAGIDLSGFEGLVNGIKNAVSELNDADWSGVAKLGIIIGIIAGGTFVTAINILSGISSGLGLVIESLGSGLAAIVNALAVAGSGDLVGGLALLGGALIDFGFALLQIPVGIIDTLAGAILDLFGLDVPSIGDWLNGIRDSIDEGIRNWVNGREPETLTLDDLVNLDLTGDEATIQSNMQTIADMIGVSLDDIAMGADLQIPLDFTFDADALAGMRLLDSIIMNPDELPAARTIATQIRNAIIADLIEQGIPIPPNAFIDGTQETGTQGTETTRTATLQMLPATTKGATVTSDEPIPTDTPLTVQPTQPVTMDMTGVSLAFSERVISGDDATTIIQDQLLPIETAWVEMFAADGEMAVSFATFSAAVTTGWTDMDTATNTFINDAMSNLPEISAVLTELTPVWVGAMNNFMNSVNSANGAINEIKTAIQDLLNLEGELSVSVSVSGSVQGEPLNSNFDGLYRVPYDGYQTELHKGERVLSAVEAREYNSIPNEIVVPSSNNNGNGASTVIMQVNGVVTLDKLLAEAKRRGIKITNG